MVENLNFFIILNCSVLLGPLFGQIIQNFLVFISLTLPMWTSQMRSHWDGMRYFKYEMTTLSHWFLTWILNDFSTKISLDISSISQFYLRIFSTTNIKIIWESQLRSQLNSQWYLSVFSAALLSRRRDSQPGYFF